MKCEHCGFKAYIDPGPSVVHGDFDDYPEVRYCPHCGEEVEYP